MVGDMEVMMWWMEAGRWMELYRMNNFVMLILMWCINTRYKLYTCSWCCNGLELCSRRISCFHAFWCFPRPILAIFHIANVFHVAVQKYYFNNEMERHKAVEVQDEKTGLDLFILHEPSLFANLAVVPMHGRRPWLDLYTTIVQGRKKTNFWFKCVIWKVLSESMAALDIISILLFPHRSNYTAVYQLLYIESIILLVCMFSIVLLMSIMIFTLHSIICSRAPTPK